VVKWLEDHPERRDGPGVYLVSQAMRDAWPC
jgi:hypothetical protein